MDIWILLTIFLLACFVGYFAVVGVTPALHSPLMSVANAISGIIIIGALTSLADSLSIIDSFLSYLACFLAAINTAGGFAVSARMLTMFKSEKKQ